MDPRRSRAPGRSPRPSRSRRTKVRSASRQAAVTVRKYPNVRNRLSGSEMPDTIWRVIRRAITSTSARRRAVTSGGRVAATDNLRSGVLVNWAILFPVYKSWRVRCMTLPMLCAGRRKYAASDALRRPLHSPGARPLDAQHRHPIRRYRSEPADPPVDQRSPEHLPDGVVGALRDRDVPQGLLYRHRLLQLHLDLVLRGDEAPPDPSQVSRALRRDLR